MPVRATQCLISVYVNYQFSFYTQQEHFLELSGNTKSVNSSQLFSRHEIGDFVSLFIMCSVVRASYTFTWTFYCQLYGTIFSSEVCPSKIILKLEELINKLVTEIVQIHNCPVVWWGRCDNTHCYNPAGGAMPSQPTNFSSHLSLNELNNLIKSSQLTFVVLSLHRLAPVIII